jgi:TRAP-type C4-dicarboxylate transport system permease small subunit
MRNKTPRFSRLAELLSEWSSWVSIVAIALVLCVGAVDIVTAKLFDKPVPGAIDIIGLLLVLVSAFGLSETELLKRHIRVDFVTMRLPGRLRYVCEAISAFISFAIWALIIWSSVKYALMLRISKEGSHTLVIPYFPFVLAMALGCIPILLVIIGQFFESVRPLKKKGKGR